MSKAEFRLNSQKYWYGTSLSFSGNQSTYFYKTIKGKESTGHLFIAENDDARQIEFYIPSKASDEVTTSSNGELKTTKTYTKVRKKAKQVNFSDFKQTDPVLSSFKDLEESEIPQKNCPINDVHDVINIQVD